jgi:hypothetical protein
VHACNMQWEGDYLMKCPCGIIRERSYLITRAHHKRERERERERHRKPRTIVAGLTIMIHTSE